MPKDILRRYLPEPSEIRENRLLKPVAHLLERTDVWHLNRRSVSSAVFVGLFCAFLPIPSQMIVAAVIALAFRCNIAIAVGLVWITNPLTIPPMFYFAYRLGAWLLDMQISVSEIDISMAWIWDNLGNIGYPLLFGSLVCAWVSGVTGFVVTRVLWRLHVISRWRARRARRRARRKASEVPQSD